MRSLEEAIKQYTEKADWYKRKAKMFPKPKPGTPGSGRKHAECIRTEKEYREIAGWLKQLKSKKDVECRNCQYRTRDRNGRLVCEIFNSMYIKDYWTCFEFTERGADEDE